MRTALLLLALAVAAPRAAAADPEGLNRAAALYHQGLYDSARTRLESLLSRGDWRRRDSLLPSSPLGSLDLSLDCDSLPPGFNLPLAKRSVVGPDGPDAPDIPNLLAIEVRDDNGDTTVLHLPFTAKPNVIPQIDIQPLAGNLYAGEPLEFRLGVRDQDNPVAPTALDWGDSSASRYTPPSGRGSNEGDTTLVHTYREPGKYVITAESRDRCGDPGGARLEITVLPPR